uniref:BFN domain-containing protein n=1 Tax=Rhodosorus marinus TaxID=101924 RepID=A0A7S0BRY0_9RHOD|mmetsp:Transcript_5479/g.7673  ORF Transcript_5479/g.7673 Transcript_5479/m.7673 type:complete len:310 (+) Transcript_5479:87-1016(+)
MDFIPGFVPDLSPNVCWRRSRVVVCQDPTVAPNFKGGWMPEDDTDYTEVRVLTMSRKVSYKEEICPTCLISLAPIKLHNKALKMTLSGSQVDSIKYALAGTKDKTSRPSTQDLFTNVIRANNGIASKCAITHVQNEIYFARIWIRTGFRTVGMDARPSDAIVLALKNQAPLYLNKRLLAKWGVSMKAIAKEVENGTSTIAQYNEKAKTSAMILAEKARLPEDKETSILKSQLDLALRLNREQEAEKLMHELRSVNPLAYLKAEHAKAIKEERYTDAAVLDEQITECKVQNWLRRREERNTEDEEEFGFL